MTLEEKNSISHRGKALFDMKKKIIKMITILILDAETENNNATNVGAENK